MIPERLHLYWEGPRPGWVDANLARLHSLHLGWQITEWAPDRLPDLGPLADHYVNAAGRVREDHVVKYRSNLVRYAALWANGGIWCDSDIICHRPFSELLGLGAFLPRGARNPQVCVIGAPVEHPFIRRVIDVAAAERPAPWRICTGVRHVDRAGIDDVTLVDVIFAPNHPDRPCPPDVVAEHRKGSA